MYKYYNANALNKFEDDCVIRAISCATGKSWDYVYDYLSDIAQYEGTLLDKRDFVINYLDKTFYRLYGIYGTIGEVSGMYPNSTLLINKKIIYNTCFYKGGEEMSCIITYQKENGDIFYKPGKTTYGKRVGDETSMGWKVLDIHYKYGDNYY